MGAATLTLAIDKGSGMVGSESGGNSNDWLTGLPITSIPTQTSPYDVSFQGAPVEFPGDHGAPSVDITRWVTPSVGGQPGPNNQLGFSTGFQSKAMRRQPFQGAGLNPGAKNVLQVGPVGLNNHAGKLYAGVESQIAVYPSQDEIAQTFIRRGIL